MKDINQQNGLVSHLKASDYENISVDESTDFEEITEFEDYEVWILLPPNQQTGGKYMISLYNKLQKAYSDNKLKLVIYCDFDQLLECCKNTQGIEESLRSLRNQRNKVIKDIKKGNFQDELECSLNEEGTVCIFTV